MLTPQFEVEQDSDFVYVKIRAPYIKASLIQFEVEAEVFVFSLPPYYLRLRFPGSLVEDDKMESAYDLATATIKCKISKAISGQHFEDLDMLSKLLAKKSTQSERPKIEEIGDRADEHDEIDWELDQNLPEPLVGVKYGFNNQYSEIMQVALESGSCDILELDEPEKASVAEKYAQNQKVKEAFDPQHYLADLYDNPMIPDLISWKPAHKWTNSHRDRLLKVAQRSYLIEFPKQTYLGVIQLLFGYCFDHRVNTGDVNVESAWTIGKLTPLMGCLYGEYSRVTPLVVDCTVRALTFPLYRHWQLVQRVWQDVVELLDSKGSLLIGIVDMLEAFENEMNNCYRQIFLEDYAIWVQGASDKVLAGLQSELIKSLKSLRKEDLDLDLSEYEEAAREALAENAPGPSDSDDEDK